VICEGDSGSPALDSTNAVMGVASRGGNDITPTASNLAASCEGNETLNYYSQVGAFRDVILQALSAMGAAPQLPIGQAIGSFCETASDCASGPCLGSGNSSYCSQMCSPSSPCPGGYSCDTISGQSVCQESTPASGCMMGARGPATGGGVGFFGVGLGLLGALLRKRSRATTATPR
jgi:hypothetical protein